MNPYLKRKREQFNALKTAIEGIQTRAAGEDRDLTEDELRSVQEQGKQAEAIADEIKMLTEHETRSAAVAELADQIRSTDDDTSDQSGDTGRGQTRITSMRHRDPGHYRSVTEGGQHSFFGDLYRSRLGDEAAGRRLLEHNRALSTGAQGVGIVPPKWLTDEYEALARQGRALANAVRHIPLGDDPRPITLPKQTAGTDAVVAEQTNENDPVTGTDAFDTDVDTVVPKPTTGKQTVSRQMVDMSSPAIDLLIYGDLIAVYNTKVEAKVGAAVLASAGAAVTTLANEAAFTAIAASDSVVDAAIAVRDARKLPANILAMSVSRWGKFLKLKDGSNRLLIPLDTAGPMNVIGVGSVAVDGQIHGLGVIATDGINTTGTYPDSYVALRASDTVLFESNMLRFRFEEQAGPESIVLGIWGYTAVIVRHAGKSAKRVQVTLA